MARLAFNNHIMELLQLPIGIDQGCPLLPISYVFYNADLVSCDGSRDTLKLSFHNDTVFLARAKMFEAANHQLMRMMTGSRGALDWAKSHKSIFEIDKTALICFTRCSEKKSPKGATNSLVQGTPLTLNGQTIWPQHTTEYLGVILDNKLCFREHITLATAKGAKWTQALKRMSHSIKGIPLHLIHRFYICTVVPSFLYAVDMFLTECSARITQKIGCLRPLNMDQ